MPAARRHTPTLATTPHPPATLHTRRGHPTPTGDTAHPAAPQHTRRRHSTPGGATAHPAAPQHTRRGRCTPPALCTTTAAHARQPQPVHHHRSLCTTTAACARPPQPVHDHRSLCTTTAACVGMLRTGCGEVGQVAVALNTACLVQRHHILGADSAACAQPQPVPGPFARVAPTLDRLRRRWTACGDVGQVAVALNTVGLVQRHHILGAVSGTCAGQPQPVHDASHRLRWRWTGCRGVEHGGPCSAPPKPGRRLRSLCSASRDGHGRYKLCRALWPGMVVGRC
jgi:hypothetical protein